jgi:hypothetical protein
MMGEAPEREGFELAFCDDDRCVDRFEQAGLKAGREIDHIAPTRRPQILASLSPLSLNELQIRLIAMQSPPADPSLTGGKIRYEKPRVETVILPTDKTCAVLRINTLDS